MHLERALWRFTQHMLYALFDLSKEFTISPYFPLVFTRQTFSPHLSDKFGSDQDFILSASDRTSQRTYVVWIIKTDNNGRYVKWLLLLPDFITL
jgi:hypothetical protein